MWFRINVARRQYSGRYEHFFATAEESLTSKATALDAFQELSRAFPFPHYNITVSIMETTGKQVTHDFLEALNARPQAAV
jgi:hypothetical protein